MQICRKTKKYGSHFSPIKYPKNSNFYSLHISQMIFCALFKINFVVSSVVPCTHVLCTHERNRRRNWIWIYFLYRFVIHDKRKFWVNVFNSRIHNVYTQGWEIELSGFIRSRGNWINPENSGEIFSPELLGLKIFPPSNLPRWCSDKAAASWPQGRGFESRLEPIWFQISQFRNKFLQVGFEPANLWLPSLCFVTAPPRQVWGREHFQAK